MGGLLSAANPVSASKQEEIKRLIGEILTTFTKNYAKYFAIALVKKAKIDAAAARAEAPLLVEKRLVETTPQLSGYLMKEGGVTKNWKRRYFVVYPNFEVKYYETEEESQKEKPKVKGTMWLWGYNVIEDPVAAQVERSKKILAQFGLTDESLIPAPKQYPPFTFEIHHESRRCWFIQCENEEEKARWVKAFKDACWYFRGMEEDFVSKMAFDEALRATRWELGRYGWWSSGGTQEERLADMINDHLEYAAMADVYRNITGAWFIRCKIRDAVRSTLNKTMSPLIAAAWKACRGAVDKVRPTIEEKVSGGLQPLFDLVANLKARMQEMVMSVVGPVMDEMVAPVIGRVVEIIGGPLTRGYDVLFQKMQELLAEIVAKAGTGAIESADKLIKPYRYKCYDYWYIRDALNSVEAYELALRVLGELISHVWPWSMIYRTQSGMRILMRNTLFTFQADLNKLIKADASLCTNPDALKAACQTVADRTMLRMRYEGTRAVHRRFAWLLGCIILPPFKRRVIPLVQKVIAPLNDMIPEPLKILVDLDEELQDLLVGTEGLATQMIMRAIAGGLPQLPPKPEGLPAVDDEMEGEDDCVDYEDI